MTEDMWDVLLPIRAKQKRILGIDGGTKTLGLALSDGLWMIASPFQTILRAKFHQDIAILKTIVQTHAIGVMVIGLPINMDGTEGPRCQSARQLRQNLAEHFDIPMVMWDERLSTAAVTRMMTQGDLSRKRRSELVDKLAASYILQGFLDRFSQKYPT